MLKILIALMVLGVLFIVLTTAIVVKDEKNFMTSWEKCNGNCSSCKDKEQCMNRPYQ